MFGAVSTIFAVCWLPYHTYFLYSFYNPSIMRAWYTPHMFLAFYWLAMANSCVNPMVYYAMNTRYSPPRQYKFKVFIPFQSPKFYQVCILTAPLSTRVGK